MDNEKDRQRSARDKALSEIGRRLAALFPGLYGSVKFNLQDGKPVNVNVEETVRLK